MKQVFANRWFLYGVTIFLAITVLLIVSKGYFFTALFLLSVVIFIGIWDILSDYN